MGLVDAIANKAAQRCRTPFEDLRQIGAEGLLRAIYRFNVEAGYTFSTFAVPWIRGEILHYQRNNRSLAKVPRAWQEFYDRAVRHYRELLQCGRAVTLREVAIALGPPDDWDIILAAVRYLPHTEIGELSSEPPYEEPPQINISGALSQLPARQRQAIARHIIQGAPVDVVAADLGISVYDARLLISNGLAHLRTLLEDSFYAPI